jgi:hypothetical protein
MERLAQLLQLLFACYLNTKVGKENFAAYTLVLKDVPVNELEVVIKQIMSNPGAFPPSPGDILEMYRRLQHHTNPQVAQQGWESVRRAILGVGSRGTPRFRDPIVQRVVQAMGWIELCASEKPGVDRAHFIKFYEAFASGEVSEQRLTPEFRMMRDAYHEDKLLARDVRLLEGDTE